MAQPKVAWVSLLQGSRQFRVQWVALGLDGPTPNSVPPLVTPKNKNKQQGWGYDLIGGSMSSEGFNLPSGGFLWWG